LLNEIQLRHKAALSLFFSNFLYNFSPDTQLVFQALKNLLAAALHLLQTTFHIHLSARHQTLALPVTKELNNRPHANRYYAPKF
jgi:hypothetical protein